MVPEAIKKFIEAFSRLPSLGPRLAIRLAFYLTALDKPTLNSLVDALGGLKNLNRCERCFFLKDSKAKLCSICSDPSRTKDIITVTEKETDLLSLEKTAAFKGQYLILGELSERGTLESVHKLRLRSLKDRIKREMNGRVKEIIIALSPTTFGDFAADLIKQEFKDLAEKITRLGRGIPTGGEIEFADEETLRQALERRT